MHYKLCIYLNLKPASKSLLYRYRFGKVSRLVYILALPYCYIIGKKLQWY